MSSDYFGSYVTRDVADLPRLINDDFLEPIQLLFSNEYYIPAAKLLVSFVDSVAYIEFGEERPNPFIGWVTTYADLSGLEITADELWEHRNSLLHMTNLQSRKVRAGNTRRLLPYVGSWPKEIPSDDPEGKFYDLHALIIALIYALEPWFETYKNDPTKLKVFIERYDWVLSDKRASRLDHDSH